MELVPPARLFLGASAALDLEAELPGSLEELLLGAR
jgi:hypothetical protein